jgi:Zn-dependent protease
MRDPLSWSVPIGRLFGITIKLHVFFPVVAVALILRDGLHKDAGPGDWMIACGLMALLFFSVLLHEFGHCFAARWVDGDAQEILLWPLGGLAFVEVPHTPRANFITVAAGPLVNGLLCLAAGAALSYWAAIPLRPLFSPWWDAFHDHAFENLSHQYWLARFFWVNWLLLLLNMVLIGFPMDAGRMFQCALWPRLGFRQATLAAVFAGFITALVVGVYSIVQQDVLFLCLALFIYATCRQQMLILEHGGEESVFGYDFSQGYTSLERDQPAPRRRRQNFWQRWWHQRAQRKMQREMERREAEERRMDELLEKVQRQGLQALTDEERRFMNRVSNRYRNRQ